MPRVNDRRRWRPLASLRLQRALLLRPIAPVLTGRIAARRREILLMTVDLVVVDALLVGRTIAHMHLIQIYISGRVIIFRFLRLRIDTRQSSLVVRDARTLHLMHKVGTGKVLEIYLHDLLDETRHLAAVFLNFVYVYNLFAL